MIFVASIAPHDLLLRRTAFASAVYSMAFDIMQVRTVEVGWQSYLFTNIAFLTIFAMSSFVVEFTFACPVLPAAKPKISVAYLQTKSSTF